MLTSLQLKNFKPFESSGPIRLAPITLVYGPNSGGKSSLIQSLLLLKQTLTPNGDSVLVTRGHQVDLGSYRSLIHRHDLARRLEISANFDGCEFERVTGQPLGMMHPSPDFKRSVRLCYHWVGGDSDGFAALDEVEYRLLNSDEEKLAVRLKRMRSSTAEDDWEDPCTFEICDDASSNSLSRYLLDCEHGRRDRLARRNPAPGALREPDMDFEMARDLISRVRILERNGLPFRIRPPRDQIALYRQMRPFFEVLGSVSSELANLLHSLSYLGPLRSHPARHYVTVSSPHSSVGSEGENAPQILHRRAFAVKLVNQWFRSFEIPYELCIDRMGNEVTGSIISIVLKDQRTQVAVASSDVGFGIGQLLPILVEGIVSFGKLLCVEQPEIHLHPRLQAHLADFFIGTTGLGEHALPRQNGNRLGPTNQWIVETHSETLMLRLQRRIREKVIRPQDVSVIYVDSGDSGSYATELRLDDHGGFIDEWPDGFFEEDVRELFGESL